MRQLLVQVPRGHGAKVLAIAQAHEGVNLARVEAAGDGEGGGRPIDLVIVHVSNRRVEGLMAALEPLPDLHVTLIPQGVIALRPPPSEAAEQVLDVEERSPIEVFLAGLQSVGSWRGFLTYAAVAGIVVWIGLFTNTSFLLVAAMLIAPFAGPAMNVAIATSRGDPVLLRRGLVRYVAALAVTIAVAALLSLILQQEVATTLMVANSQVSVVAALVPLAAGTVGALQLVHSERSSLVSGAATGMLIAASLAPPAGVVGMGAAIGRFDMAVNGLFLLALQLAGINLAAALVFRLAGLSPQGARYERGRRLVFPAALAVSAAALAGLLALQFVSPPELQRPTRAQRAVAAIGQAVQESGLADPIEVNARFTRPEIPGQNTLLGVIYVQRRAEVDLPAEDIRDRLTQAIQAHLLEHGFNVTPLIDVSVLQAP